MPIFLLVLLLTGGVSVGAQGSVPGDVLYPVKISVNENVRALLAVSADAQADLDIELAERRLKEAEDLAAEGSFNAEARATVESNFKRHAEAVEARIAELKKEDANKAAELSIRFQNSLNAHQETLARFSAESAEAGALVVEVGSRLKKSVDVSAQAGTVSESNANLDVGVKAGIVGKTETTATSGASQTGVKASSSATVKIETGAAKIDAKGGLQVKLGQ